MPSRPKLYGYPISHYCICADRILAFKGIPFEPVYVSYYDKRELLRATGQDYVPALVWDDQVVTWEQIPDFLETTKPEPSLYPGGNRALARTLENWGHQVLEERVWRYVVTRVPAVLHDEVERWTFEEIQTRARGPWPVLEQRREEYRLDMEKHLQFIEEMLQKRDWLLESPSLADFGVYGGLSPLLTVGEEIPARFPRTRSWSQRIQALGTPPVSRAASLSALPPIPVGPE
ncbi:MAG TPA: glutathione S-transferase family protein [Thermoplasmata archaeon]|nr:glutathione S-transferase family protein [Thermoplasmata archaeon]